MTRWDKLLDAGPEELGTFIVDRVYRPETIQARGEAWRTKTVYEVGNGFPPGTRAHIDLIRHADVREAVWTTRQPLLLVVPTRDEFVTPDHSEELHRLRPDAHVEDLDAGHAVGDEQGDEWFAVLKRFLDHHAATSNHT